MLTSCDEVLRRVLVAVGEDEQRAADLHAVAALERPLAHRLAVDERAVRAVQIGEDVTGFVLAEVGVPAGDFAVVELDQIGCRRGRA